MVQLFKFKITIKELSCPVRFSFSVVYLLGPLACLFTAFRVFCFKLITYECMVINNQRENKAERYFSKVMVRGKVRLQTRGKLSTPTHDHLTRPPRYAGGIWNRIFVSTVRPTVYTNPSRKRNFSKFGTLFKQEEYDNVILKALP